MTAPVPHGRVLIVEDDADTVLSLVVLLRLAGFDPRGLPDGEGVLRTVEAFRPFAVILDILMPGHDGCEVAELLLALPDRPRVVVYSGSADPGVWARLRSAGVDLCLVKPADPKELVAWLTAVCTSGPGEGAIVGVIPDGERLTADEVAKSRGVHPRTVRRWMRYGARRAGGRAVTLSYRRIDGKYFTTRAWLDQFLAAIDPGAAP